MLASVTCWLGTHVARVAEATEALQFGVSWVGRSCLRLLPPLAKLGLGDRQGDDGRGTRRRRGWLRLRATLAWREATGRARSALGLPPTTCAAFEPWHAEHTQHDHTLRLKARPAVAREREGEHTPPAKEGRGGSP